MSIAEAEAEAETVDTVPSHWEVVLRAWEQLDLPEGWRAEIIEGDIHIVTPPKDEHSEIIDQLQTRLFREKFRDGSRIGECTVHQNIDLRIPESGSLYIPDLVVLPGSVMDRGPEHSASDALLVVEVTSRSTADRDRKAKLRGYAHAQIPLYLLVDRWDPATGRGEVTLFSGPENGTYTSVVKVPFGKDIHLPEPFDLTLDTSGFPA
ncbi:Uma2 family endonuclease [Nocardiopsis sp. Huas11]|uniref:Uma2 family endonuclease n=1 Tax=Nocardiopsis sp. Huas11 TaxID=2183912 RepID=UPI000EB33BF0|nr:Uma2 family endonuclease [Nocardiopsis sp. Huas11]